MKDDVATEEAVAAPEQATVSLSIGDLANIRQIIDVATQRGAFKADELAVVGNTYNRLNAFLGTIAANVEAAKAEGNEETDAEGEAEASTEE